MDTAKDIIDRINAHLEDHGMRIEVRNPETDLPVVEEGPPVIDTTCHICGEDLLDGYLCIPTLLDIHRNVNVGNAMCCVNLKDCLKRATDRDTEIKKRVTDLRTRVVLPL